MMSLSGEKMYNNNYLENVDLKLICAQNIRAENTS